MEMTTEFNDSPCKNVQQKQGFQNENRCFSTVLKPIDLHTHWDPDRKLDMWTHQRFANQGGHGYIDLNTRAASSPTPNSRGERARGRSVSGCSICADNEFKDEDREDAIGTRHEADRGETHAFADKIFFWQPTTFRVSDLARYAWLEPG